MKTWAAMASLLSDASSASDMASYIGPVSAFFLSARRKRITCTPSATLISISWVIPVSSLLVGMPGLVPGIQPPASARASGTVDPGDKRRDDEAVLFERQHYLA